MPAADEASFDICTRTLLGSMFPDVYQDNEQAEILHLAQQSCCEPALDKVGNDTRSAVFDYLLAVLLYEILFWLFILGA